MPKWQAIYSCCQDEAGRYIFHMQTPEYNCVFVKVILSPKIKWQFHHFIKILLIQAYLIMQKLICPAKTYASVNEYQPGKQLLTGFFFQLFCIEIGL